MIKAKGLRLGNLFQTVEGKVYCQICELSLEDYEGNGIHWCNLENNFEQYEAVGGNRDIEAIPLTPEILEKCGFKSYIRNYWVNEKQQYEAIHYYEKKQLIDFYFDKFKRNKWVSDRLFMFDYGIEYLHQLQNLYFAMTGEELEVNL